MSGDESTSVSSRFYYDPGVLYEINGRLDDAQAMNMNKMVTSLEMNGVVLKAISAVCRTREYREK